MQILRSKNCAVEQKLRTPWQGQARKPQESDICDVGIENARGGAEVDL